MDIEKVLHDLEEIRTYCSVAQLNSLVSVIKVFKKLEEEGIKDPLQCDFSLLKK